MSQKIANSIFNLIHCFEFEYSRKLSQSHDMPMKFSDCYNFDLADLSKYIDSLEFNNNNAMLLLSSLKLLARAYLEEDITFIHGAPFLDVRFKAISERSDDSHV